MAIRTAAFHRHCRLVRLPGRGPLAGDILSHDQVEAALMRRAGYQVRVLAAEDESFEDNPPSLPDFIIRELRWCNGNLQYLGLLSLPGLKPLSRVQLGLAILMYLSPAAWFAFLVMGAALAGNGAQFAGVSPLAGLAFFATVMAMNLMPRFMGLGQVLADPAAARRYGGRGRVILGGVVETVFSLMTAPVVAFAVTVGVVRLMLGRRAVWDAQVRVRSGRLGWGEATRALWPQTLAGLAMAVWLAATAPWALWFAAPVALPLMLAIPVAVLTTWPPLGALSRRFGILSIPEELTPARAAAPARALRAA
jgi:membrane glycosyltransferase